MATDSPSLLNARPGRRLLAVLAHQDPIEAPHGAAAPNQKPPPFPRPNRAQPRGNLAPNSTNDTKELT